MYFDDDEDDSWDLEDFEYFEDEVWNEDDDDLPSDCDTALDTACNAELAKDEWERFCAREPTACAELEAYNEEER